MMDLSTFGLLVALDSEEPSALLSRRAILPARVSLRELASAEKM